MSKSTSTDPPELWDPVIVQLLKDRYECPNFRILIVGRANAGKTTILEKVCGVQQGTKPIISRAPAPSLVRRFFKPPKPKIGTMSSLDPSIHVSDIIEITNPSN